jgi:hypothetical protein
MPIPLPSTRGGLFRLALGSVAAVAAVLVGLSGRPASADGPDVTFNWDSRPGAWSGHPPPSPYAYGPHGYRRHPEVACGTNTVVGAAFGAGVGGLIGSQISERRNDAGPTVMGMLMGAVLGGIIGQSADRANGC